MTAKLDQPDAFDDATAIFRASSEDLIERGLDPVIIADAMITQALAIWAADCGRSRDASNLIKIWAAIRDGRDG